MFTVSEHNGCATVAVSFHLLFLFLRFSSCQTQKILFPWDLKKKTEKLRLMFIFFESEQCKKQVHFITWTTRAFSFWLAKRQWENGRIRISESLCMLFASKPNWRIKHSKKKTKAIWVIRGNAKLLLFILAVSLFMCFFHFHFFTPE